MFRHPLTTKQNKRTSKKNRAHVAKMKHSTRTIQDKQKGKQQNKQTRTNNTQQTTRINTIYTNKIYSNNTTQLITSITNHNRVAIGGGRTGDMKYDARP